MKSTLLGRAALLATVLLPLVLSAQPAPSTGLDNVVIVLDASGSMREAMPGTRNDKMSTAKTALKRVLSRIPQNTQVGLLVFSAKGNANHWFYPLAPRNDNALTQAIDQVVPFGDTPLGKYIKIGADRLLQERDKNLGYGSYRLLIVTDGEAQDQALVNRYTPEAMSRGLRLDVIGVAMNQTHTLATKVQSYRAANDEAALAKALAEVFAEVGGGRDQLDAGVFELVAPIPQEMAVAMIKALASPAANQPLGERPKVQIAPTPTPPSAPSQAPAPPQSATPTQPQAAPAPGTAQTGSAPNPAPNQPPKTKSRSRSYFLPIIIGVVIVLVMTRKRRR